VAMAERHLESGAMGYLFGMPLRAGIVPGQLPPKLCLRAAKRRATSSCRSSAGWLRVAGLVSCTTDLRPEALGLSQPLYRPAGAGSRRLVSVWPPASKTYLPQQVSTCFTPIILEHNLFHH
jgi:hypothetical protein